MYDASKPNHLEIDFTESFESIRENFRAIVAGEVTGTFANTINANATGANLRLKGGATDALDGAIFVTADGTISVGNWAANRGFRIDPDGSITRLGGGVFYPGQLKNLIRIENPSSVSSITLQSIYRSATAGADFQLRVNNGTVDNDLVLHTEHYNDSLGAVKRIYFTYEPFRLGPEVGVASTTSHANAAEWYSGSNTCFRSRRIATPTITLSAGGGITDTNILGGYPSADAITTDGFRYLALSNAAGVFQTSRTYTTSA